MDPNRRRKLVDDLEAAVRTATDALESASDALTRSRQTTRRARRVIQESARDDAMSAPPLEAPETP